jgi:hypothetical protein
MTLDCAHAGCDFHSRCVVASSDALRAALVAKLDAEMPFKRPVMPFE